MISGTRQSQKTVLDVSPSLTQNDLTDGIVTETKISADICHALACGVTGSDLQDDLLGKTLSVSAIFERVLGISLRGSPLKVRENVIGSDEVDMVDLRQPSRIGDEGYPHKAMDWVVLHLPIAVGKRNSSISIFVGFRRENSWGLGDGLGATPKWVSDNTPKTTDASDIGNLVQDFITNNRSPLFSSPNGHVASPKACDLTQAVYSRSWGGCQHSELFIKTKEFLSCP